MEDTRANFVMGKALDTVKTGKVHTTDEFKSKEEIEEYLWMVAEMEDFKEKHPNKL